MDSFDIRNRVETIEELPTLPVVVTQILQATKSMATNANDVGELISSDQSLTAKVLKLVNSPFYGFPQKIKTITHAIVILGFSKVKNIVLAASVFGMAKQPKNSTLNLCDLWEHALTTGIICRQISKHRNNGYDIEELFVAGLLHDLGKVIIICNFPDVCAALSSHIKTNDCLFYDAEQSLLNFSHDKLGVWLGEKWNLNPALLEGIRCHHSPLSSRGEREIPYIVHVGNILSRALDIGNAGDDKIPLLNKKVVEELGLSESLIDQILGESLIEIDKAKDFFDLIHKQK